MSTVPAPRGSSTLVLLTLATGAAAQSGAVVFERQELSDVFFCEGAAFGDLDGDGEGDVVSGPYWYAGPGFEQRFELYEPKPFDPLRYSDNFFAWTRDLDGDRDLDVLFVGFPGRAAWWVENPGNPRERADHWPAHTVFEGVDNESPRYVDLVGDGAPELVFMRGGRFGYAQPDPADPRAPWTFTSISEVTTPGPFVHGLGVGDVNGDGRADVLHRRGWFEQPAQPAPTWEHHAVDFAAGRRGGAQMFVDDLDGDGDPDVLTSLDAHGWGLSWFEQTAPGAFVERRVMDDTPAANSRGRAISELHALAHADVDGDGLRDLVTGKRFWAHGPEGSPGAGDPADLFWWRLVRREGADGTVEVDLEPYAIDHASGVGTQVTAGDVDGDGRELNLDFERGDLSDWRAEGDAFDGQPVTGDTVRQRLPESARIQGSYWIGGYELHGDRPTGRLISAPFRVDLAFASFLVGGGSAYGTRIELARVGSDEPFYTIQGPNYERMQRVVVDLAAQRGQLIEIRLVDEVPGGWGHLNFDDFRLHPRRPHFARDPRVPRILPRDTVAHAGLTSEAAVEAMTLPPGFSVQLLAAEPDLHQPITFTIDAKGRIWVVEAYSYPTKRAEGEGRDTILVLEDTDHDGSYERRTVFADDLNLVSGLEVGFGGVWVGQAPELLFFPDRDDDLVPDGPPKVLLDGWGMQDTHETLNSFTWGPDGWLYGCHGVFTHSRVGKPGTPDAERQGINAGLWRYHPLEHRFEVFAWGTSNPWGVAFDRHGEAFLTACVIPHLYHAVQGGRYQRQAGSHFNPYVYADIQTIADHRHYLGDTPHGGNNRSNAAGGGHAHCGALIYRGHTFPPEWRDRIYMANIHGNRLNTDRFEPRGSGFVGRHGEDFLLANDTWFRAVHLRTGPDGSMYVADWYDAQACHLTDPVRWDRTNGRLYRVSYGAPTPVAVDLHAQSDAELARMQLHENAWFADRSRVVLQERAAQGPLADEALEALGRILSGHEDSAYRLRALWTLHAVGGLTEELARRTWNDAAGEVRGWIVRLLTEDGDAAPLAGLEGLSDDPSPVVRRNLASALQRFDPVDRWPYLQALLARAEDVDDPNLPFLLWYALEPLVALDAPRALALVRGTPFQDVARFAARRAAATPETLGALVVAIGAEPDAARQREMLDQALKALETQRNVPVPADWGATYLILAEHADEAIRRGARALAAAFGDASTLPVLLEILSDAKAPLDQRRQALDALVRARHAPALDPLVALVGDADLGGAALRGLADFGDPTTPAAVLEAYDQLTPERRRDALNTLAGRAPWARELLEAVADGRVPRTDVGAFVVRQIGNHRDPELDRLVASAWGQVRDLPEEKAARLAELSAALGPETLAAADLSHGRALFARNCQQCHTLFGVGDDLGPDLTGSNRADLDYLLRNLVDPSAEVGLDYQATLVWLLDGRVVSGLLEEENDSALVLRTENERVVVAREDVDEVLPSDLSTMPDGLLDALSPEDVRDLVAYLASPTQVPQLLLQGDALELFDGATLEGWRGDSAVWSVQEGAIAGRTPGLSANTFLRSEVALADFRLTLEVRLDADEGNSGIQFRSRELDGGDVAGYQADVGRGYWGSLYDEHGRGTLHGAPARAAGIVRRGEWNTYEITAVGSRIQTRLNGELCVDLDDPEGPASGILALQVHSGVATDVRFRNLRLELNPTLED